MTNNTNNTITCLVKLRAGYESFNPATKKVADYILNNPGDVIEYSVMDLAERIKVSSFSILSCLKAAGYSGYKEFKMSMALEYDPLKTTLFEGILIDDDPYTMFVKTINKKIQSLHNTEKLITHEEILRAANMIAASERMETYGIGYSGYAADMLSMNLRRIGKNTVFYSDPNYQRMSSVVLKSGDLALGFSASGETESICDALRLAKKSGASTIAITSVSHSSVTRNADLTILTSYSDPILIKDTLSAPMEQIAIVSALTLIVAYMDAPHALVNLSETSSAINKKKF